MGWGNLEWRIYISRGASQCVTSRKFPLNVYICKKKLTTERVNTSYKKEILTVKGLKQLGKNELASSTIPWPTPVDAPSHPQEITWHHADKKKLGTQHTLSCVAAVYTSWTETCTTLNNAAWQLLARLNLLQRLLLQDVASPKYVLCTD